MTKYVFDGTHDGFFTCVFEAFLTKNFPSDISDGAAQCEIGDIPVYVKTDKTKAERVVAGIKKSATKTAYRDIKFAMHSGKENKYFTCFSYAVYVIKNKTVDVSRNFSENYVLRFNDLIYAISQEIHRFKGFIRFAESDGNFLYAHYSPDNDITAYLMPHFKSRLKNYPFVIHDTARNILGMYNGKDVATVYAGNKTVSVFLSENENYFSELWKTYYNNVCIEERKNERLMKQFMPVRYWKNLPEKKDEAPF